ncbi:MAG: hypothetical protein KC493_05760 [Bacteriovoracaceae bacterium]|nr:hypothetical protein [Bacteriovoracaceae bacterium]
MKMLIYLILLSSILSSCSFLEKQRKESLKKKIKASPIQRLSYWDKYKDLPLEERIVPATDEMIKLLNLQNELGGFEEKPKIHKLSKREKEIIKRVVSNIPEKLKKKIESRLAGIMIVDNLGGTGLADAVFEGFSKGYIVFDKLIFNKKANDWCTWKESSLFKKGKIKLKCIIASKDSNTVERAFEYILMHELGHILNLDNPLLPFWVTDPALKVGPAEQYDYLKLSWVKPGENFESKYFKKYKKLNNLPYYKPNQALENKAMLEVYNELGKTNFPSLYGATNLWDDFAETFVTYYHSIYHKRPWKIELQENGKVVKTITPCLKQVRCRNKMKIIEDLYFR